LTVDSSLLWAGAALAILAAVLLAFVPRLPSAGSTQGLNLASGSVRITGGTKNRLRVFAVTQIAASFVLLAGAAMLFKALLALQAAQTGMETRRVLVLNVPPMSFGKTREQVRAFYRETIQRVSALPGVERVAAGTSAPWRDAGNFGPGLEFSADGYVRAPGEEYPRARFRAVSPNFFPALGIPLLAGRDFNDADREASEMVVIVSQSLAQRMFPHGDAVNRHILWTDPVIKFISLSPEPRRIVGVVADVDDENVVPGPAMTVYHPFEQMPPFGGRLFVHTAGDPYSLVQPVTRAIRDLSADQIVERPSTLEDIRAEVLAPDRLNALVFGVFAGVALVIAVVGVAGVLAFSVSARTREFGIRLAMGAQPRHLLTVVIAEGALMAVAGVVAGGAGGSALFRLGGSYFADLKNVAFPGILVVTASAAVLLAAAVTASVLPAARAARVDAIEALRAE
jgi:predicted permease